MSYFFETYHIANGFKNNPTLYINGKLVKPYDPEKGHSGVDWLCPAGTPLTLPMETICVQVLEQEQMGKTVYLQANDGNILVFGHNSHIPVVKGDKVPRDGIFAYSGNTGSVTTGDHSHGECISQVPEEGSEHMTRSLGGFSGYNIDIQAYLVAQLNGTPDKVSEADLAQRKLMSRGIITQPKDHNAPAPWGEVIIALSRMID